jgi:hypothetical protein
MQTDGVYKAVFPEGSKVRVADRAFLQNFKETWKYHHKLLPEQLGYADAVATVEKVGVYHGGDQLYDLKDIPGIWHPECLRPT